MRYKYDEQEDSQLWTDWKLSQAIVQSWDNFFIGHKTKPDEELDSASLEKTIRSLLFAKNQDEMNSIVELLM